MIIMCIDMVFMVCKAAVLWIQVFYRTIFPAALKPINGKIVLVC